MCSGGRWESRGGDGGVSTWGPGSRFHAELVRPTECFLRLGKKIYSFRCSKFSVSRHKKKMRFSVATKHGRRSTEIVALSEGAPDCKLENDASSTLRCANAPKVW